MVKTLHTTLNVTDLTNSESGSARDDHTHPNLNSADGDPMRPRTSRSYILCGFADA
jgi:hypothetical protein